MYMYMLNSKGWLHHIIVNQSLLYEACTSTYLCLPLSRESLAPLDRLASKEIMEQM